MPQGEGRGQEKTPKPTSSANHMIGLSWPPSSLFHRPPHCWIFLSVTLSLTQHQGMGVQGLLLPAQRKMQMGQYTQRKGSLSRYFNRVTIADSLVQGRNTLTKCIFRSSDFFVYTTQGCFFSEQLTALKSRLLCLAFYSCNSMMPGSLFHDFHCQKIDNIPGMRWSRLLRNSHIKP